MIRFGRRQALALVGTVLLTVVGGLWPAAVLAHAELVSSTPADGSELTAPATAITLVFSERPSLDSLSVRLFDRQGTEIALGEPSTGPYPTTIVIPIPSELRAGPYTVVWYVVSAEDRHPEAKQFVFGVREPPGAPSVTAADLSGSGSGPLVPLAALLAAVGLTLMLGAAFQAALFRLAGNALVWSAVAGAALLLGSMVTAAAAAPRAAARIVEQAGGPFAGADPTDVARIGLLAVLALLIALAAALPAATSRRRSWLAAFGVAVALAWLQASKSHAAGVGILPWVGAAWSAIDLAIADPARYAWFGTLFEAARQFNVAVATAHTVAVGVWIGGLLIASLHRFAPHELVAWHPRFSRVALVAFLVVAATGLYQAVLYLPSPGAIVGSDYGRVLIAKHVFVAGVLAMAGLNRFVAGPALRRVSDVAAATGRAVRMIRVEAAIGVAVLVATGVLATTTPERPATAIFLRPDIVARLQDPRIELAGDRADARLTVAPISDTQHRFTIEGSGLDLAPSATLSIYSPADKIERELPLRGSGSGWTAEGLAFPRDGVWVVSAPLADGGAVNFRLEVRFGRVALRDDAARQTWDAAIERSENEMRSARMIDQLTDGLSLILFGYHEFVAPDRERFDIQGRFASVGVDGKRFTRDAGTDSWTVRSTALLGTTPPGSTGGGPNSWPWFGFLRSAVGVTLEGEASQAGQRCQVFVGVDPQSAVTYEVWIGRTDGMIHRLVMGVPGHYMVNAYFDVNAPITIEAPDGPVSPAN